MALPASGAAAAVAASLRLLLLMLPLLPASAQEGLEEGLLGAACQPSGRCLVRHSRCEGNVCVCPKHNVASGNGRRCLPVVEALGGGCDEDAQCLAAHAWCRRRERECACRKGHVDGGGRCLAEATLGGACEHPVQCTGLTECSAPRQRCVCKGIAFEADGQCVTDDPRGSVRDWEPPPQPAPPDGAPSAAARALDRGSGSTRLFIGVLCGVLLILAFQQVR